jgi:hypothetical protein
MAASWSRVSLIRSSTPRSWRRTWKQRQAAEAAAAAAATSAPAEGSQHPIIVVWYTLNSIKTTTAPSQHIANGACSSQSGQ